MSYNYLVVGAGMMGEAVAYDLIRDPDTKSVEIADINYSNAKKLSEKLNSPIVTSTQADASNLEQMISLMKRKDAAVGVSSYKFNETLTKAAIASKTHFVDAGGNNDVVKKQFDLYPEARTAGVKIVPAHGIAPGAVSTIVALGMEELEGKPTYVFIRVGGLPQKPEGELGYSIVFSVEGLINEYIENAEIIQNGKKDFAFSLDEVEQVIFNHSKFKGILEAAYTSGGTSTLTDTLQGKIMTLNYKTLRYPGHWEKLQMLANKGMFGSRKRSLKEFDTPEKIMDEIFSDKYLLFEEDRKVFERIGFFSEEKIEVNSLEISNRKFTEYILEKNLPRNQKDMLISRVRVGNKKAELQYDMVDLFDEKTGHSAMQRTTGYSIAIVAEMLAKGSINDVGVLHIEKSIPPKMFVNEWKKRNIILDKSIRTPDSTTI